MSKNEFLKSQELQIQECIRAFQIELRHLDPLKRAFIAADKQHIGVVTVKEIIEELHNDKINLPQNILHFFINTLLIKDNESNNFDG